jgi:secondary thiamine-phosphate synthase enzyme
MQTLGIRSSQRVELIDVTHEVTEVVRGSGVAEGFCLVYVPHTTAAVTINENADPSVVRDVIRKLSELVPQDDAYSHSEGNSDAHVKSTLVGCSTVIPVQGGRLVLGTWQAVYFCEFDGPRSRRVIVQVQGE